MGAEGRAVDRIELRGLRAFGRHGVLEHERRHGQAFVVDVTVETDLAPAAASDDLDKTLDYAVLARAVEAAVRGTQFQLLEALAAHLADLVLDGGAGGAGIAAVEVRVAKPAATLSADVAEVAVVVRREQRR